MKIYRTGEDFPTFLYDVSDKDYSEECLDGGLLKGQVLEKVDFVLLSSVLLRRFVQVYRHIFCGPGTAAEDKLNSAGLAVAKGRSCNLRLHKMVGVTPRSIAYAAIQVWHFSIHFTLSYCMSFSVTSLSVQCRNGVRARTKLISLHYFILLFLSLKVRKPTKHGPKTHSIGGTCKRRI